MSGSQTPPRGARRPRNPRKRKAPDLSLAAAAPPRDATAVRLTTRREVLFFGDSLTWGMSHCHAARYTRTWPQLLESRLHAQGYRCVESALCSRTTRWDDDWEHNQDWMPGSEAGDFNGLRHFGPLFSSHTPSVLVLALGTNDLKTRIRSQTLPAAQRMLPWLNRRTAYEEARVIAENCAAIGEKARVLFSGFCHEGPTLKIVVLTPPDLVLTDSSEKMGYDARSAEISHAFPQAFQDMCEEHGFVCVAGKAPSMEKSTDGVHYTSDAQAELAESVWAVLSGVLQEGTRMTRRRRRALAEEETAGGR